MARIEHPFSIELANEILSGELSNYHCETKEGTAVKLICTDLDKKTFPVAVVVETPNGKKQIRRYSENGYLNCFPDDINDLVIIEETLPDFKFLEPVLVREGEKMMWFDAYFIEKTDDEGDGPFRVLWPINWRMCIPRKGNEHLLYTFDSPK